MRAGSEQTPEGTRTIGAGYTADPELRPEVVFNALASTAGGGITYLRNVVPRLSALSESLTFTVLVDARVGPQLIAAGLDSRNVRPVSVPRWGWSRVLWEQRYLRRFCRQSRADVLVSLGNFACLGSPVPQVLFNRSDLFYSPEFRSELWRRRRLGMLLGNEVRGLLSRLSVRVADVNVAPTRAFADRLRATRGLKHVAVRVLPFGFDPAAFTGEKEGLSDEELRELRVGEDVRRIVIVSHYNYFRNFETLLRALPLIKEHSSSPVLLVLTTRLARGLRDGVYDTTLAARLAERLGITRDLVMLGRVPYSKVHHLLAHCDIFVLPSFSETFGHPMVEAMASGLPVVAADQPVHREVCGDAALYFPAFDQQALAERCVRLLQDRELHEGLRQRGLARAQQFSWDEHVRGLKAVIESCIAQPEKAVSAEPRQAVQTRVPLSVLIPARNDAVNLERCLAPLQGWADEVVVVDSGSADDTAAIARRYGASVVQFEYRGGWPKKRQWALDTVPLRNGWVLLLDADEILDEKVKAEICRSIASDNLDGYWVRFNMIFLGRPLRFGGTALWKLCLFRRGSGRFELRLADQDSSMADIEVHEHVLVDGPVGRLGAAVRHENVSSLDRYIAKHNEYSNWEAAVLLEGLDGGVRPTLFGNQAQRRRWLKRAFTGVPGSPLALFLLKYVLQLGFLDGKPGLIYCWLQAVQLFHSKAKMVERKRSSSGTR